MQSQSRADRREEKEKVDSWFSDEDRKTSFRPQFERGGLNEFTKSGESFIIRAL
jgi:hypothetical protein